MPRCSYLYSSGDRCIYNGCTTEGDMCPAHNFISGQQTTKRAQAANGDVPKRRPRSTPRVTQPSRVQSAKQIIDQLPAAPVIGRSIDPSAPYCTCEGRTADHQPCASCGKPHFMDWREMVKR